MLKHEDATNFIRLAHAFALLAGMEHGYFLGARKITERRGVTRESGGTSESRSQLYSFYRGDCSRNPLYSPFSGFPAGGAPSLRPHQVQSKIYAALLHCGRITWRSSDRLSFGDRKST